MFSSWGKLVLVFILRRYFPVLLFWLLSPYPLIICSQQERHFVSSWTLSPFLLCFCILVVVTAADFGPDGRLLPSCYLGSSLFSSIPRCESSCTSNDSFLFLPFASLFHFFLATQVISVSLLQEWEFVFKVYNMIW